MDESLNPLQNIQMATSWELAAKWAHGQGVRGPWNVDSWLWDNHSAARMFTSEGSSRGIQQSTLEHHSDTYQNLDLDLGLSMDSCNKEKNEMPDLIADKVSSLRRKRFLVDERNDLLPVSQSGFPDSDASLTLKLGAETYPISEEGNISQNGKRCRVVSPGSQSPVCQVDDCCEDLSNAKYYHRRHRVCEVHAKANKAPVGRLMQRFCQQCSRFHVLQEFDEGKRSCRRRLAGHNRRRRKTQPASLTTFQSANEGATKEAGLIGLLNMWCQLQGLRSLNPTDDTNDFERLLQLLNEAYPGLSEQNNSLMNGGGLTMPTVEHPLIHESSSDQLSKSQASLATLASIYQETLSIFKKQMESRREELPMTTRLPGVCAGNFYKTNPTDLCINHATSDNTSPLLPQTLQYQMATNALLSLKGPITPSDMFPISSDNLLENGMPTDKNVKVSDASKTLTCDMYQSKRLDGNPITDMSSKRILDGKTSYGQLQSIINMQNVPCEQASPPSASGSEHSSEEDMQEHTGRIVFKLFDRHPGEIPQNLRSQIFEWLCQRPTNMESYIRPGCVILCMFVSMHELSWQELLVDVELSLKRLLQIGNCTFWNRGCILVQIEKTNAFIVDGEVYAIKREVSASLPQVVSVRPLAVVAGEETEITLKGHNLAMSGTHIVCAYDGGYEVRKALFRQPVAGSCVEPNDQALGPQQELIFIFKEAFNTIGRCFIEVEWFALGDFVPVIITDKEVCAEICTLESELESAASCINNQDVCRAASCPKGVKAEVRKFLNELGWFFHLESLQVSCSLPEISTSTRISFARFKHLVLYAIDHDWCAVLRKLLDLFFTNKLGLIESVLALRLLHRAVKRKCRPIVDMLLAYNVTLHDSTDPDVPESKDMKDDAACRMQFVFRPNVPGHEGLTPLHIAASMQDAEELVDALTNDSAKVGIEAWNSCRDAIGQTPLAYALARGFESYVNLVEAKRLKSCKGISAIMISNLDIESKELESCVRPETDDQNTSPALRSGADAEERSHASCSIEMPNFPTSRLADMPCKLCRYQMLSKRTSGMRGPAFRPFLLSMVAITTLCVSVCIVLKGPPEILFVIAPFTWGSVKWGFI